MKNSLLIKSALTLCALVVFSQVNAPAQTIESSNLIEDPDIELMAEAPLPQEEFNTFMAPVATELQMENTFFNVTSEKAHSGKKSIKIALTPETSKKWQKKPGKPDSPNALWLHYSFAPTKKVTPLWGKKVVFSCWVFVEKGAFNANLLCRGYKRNGDVERLIEETLFCDQVGKWVQLKAEGQGEQGVIKADVRLQLDCPGNYTVYLDDFYYGPGN